MKTTQNVSHVCFLHLVAYSSLSDRGVHVTKLPNPSIAYVYKCFSDVHEVSPVGRMSRECWHGICCPFRPPGEVEMVGMDSRGEIITHTEARSTRELKQNRKKAHVAWMGKYRHSHIKRRHFRILLPKGALLAVSR
jgi:hypothetical protein